MELFLELSAIIVLATILAIIVRFLKQPLVVAYLLTGILIGPQFFNILQSTDYIDLFSKIGITILLFVVGLNLSPAVIKEVGKVSFIGGLGQIVLTFVIGFLLSSFLGISTIHALYVGLAVSFSSTIIILKLLSDKGDLPKLYGKITVGFLLIQDLIAIVSLIFITTFAHTQQTGIAQIIFFLFLKLFLAGIALYVISKYLFSWAIHHLAESQELLFLFSIAWGLGIASVFYVFGFSEEIGALAAGVSLSISPFADSIASRLKPLRDFFIVLFFILLGSTMVFATIAQLLIPVIILSLFVLVGKPLIVFFLMNILGYKTKQGFQTGVALAQVSEFSLILAALGASIGQLDTHTVSLITAVALITIIGSSYFISYSDNLYVYVEKMLKQLEMVKTRKKISDETIKHELVLFGFDRVGRDFIEAFKKLEKNYVVIDYNPEMINQLEKNDIPFKYGDAEDIEFLQELQMEKVKMCISTIPNFNANVMLVKMLKKDNPKAILIVRAREIHEAKKLYELGATYVLMPHYLGAKYATAMIKRIGLDVKGFEDEREKHKTFISASKLV